MSKIELAEQLHIWYLEATKELHPESYNTKAQVAYKDLSAEQKQIDKYIALALKQLLIKKVEGKIRSLESWEAENKEFAFNLPKKELGIFVKGMNHALSDVIKIIGEL